MLKRKARKPSLEIRHEGAKHRCGNLATPSLYEWVDQVLYTYGKCLQDCQESTDLEYSMDLLEEAQVAALVAYEIAAELKSRYEVDTIRPHG